LSEIEVSTNSKRLSFVGRCIVCRKKITNGDRYVKFHGCLYCENEDFAQTVLNEEERLNETAQIKLVRLTSGKILKLAVDRRGLGRPMD
jgi:hypothetical protein